MNFQESVEYLFGLGYELSVKKFGLENTRVLLGALGEPHREFRKVQIAGTNGKGSTCAFLESILVEAGIRTGLNTSPHLVSVTERIRVDGVDISEENFASYVTRVRRISEELVASGRLEGMPTFFEHLTCIAQRVFADERVGVAVLETGLGGRFDATTATRAEIVALTPIDLDHTKTLGGTIELIAAEKAAIIRSDTRVFSAPQKESARRVIEEKCRLEGVAPVWSGAAVPLRGERSGRYLYKTEKSEYEFGLSMPGKHQLTNAALAIHLAEALAEDGFPVTRTDIERGLLKATHQGRLEYLEEPGQPSVLFDGAHNASGAGALREYLETAVERPLTIVFAAMGGKDLGEISRLLFPLAERVIVTTPENPRAMPAGEIAAHQSVAKHAPELLVIEDVPEAFRKALELAGREGLVLVTGSLYLIGEVKAWLGDRKVERRGRI